MKASDLERAANLRMALKQLAVVRGDLKAREPEVGYDRRVLTVQVEDVSASGSIGEVGAHIDLVTGDFVVDVVEIILRNELRMLGVKYVARRKRR